LLDKVTVKILNVSAMMLNDVATYRKLSLIIVGENSLLMSKFMVKNSNIITLLRKSYNFQFMQTVRIFTEFYYKILIIISIIKLLVNLICEITYSNFNLRLFFNDKYLPTNNLCAVCIN